MTRPTRRLTTAPSVTALRPEAQRYLVRDSQVSGLELCVLPTGRKVWSVRYRINGQQRRLRLGVYHPERLTLAQARTRANRELRNVDAGTDPQAARTAARVAREQAAQDTIEALCETYIERHARVFKKSWRDDASKIRNEILPRWKGRPVTSITRRDCRDLLQAVADRPAPVHADRIRALLGRICRFAVERDIIAASPAVHLPRFTPRVTEAPLKAYDPDEVRAIWQATDTLAPAARALYRLGLLTGQRPGEVAGMRWSELDGSWWSLPPDRTKNAKAHRVYLVDEALDELARVPRIVDEPHVFAGTRGKPQIRRLNPRVFAGLRPRAKPRHAMRDTVATGLAAAGVAVEIVARVLNHSSGPTVTATYNSYRYDAEKHTAMQAWARRLDAILRDEPAAASVVPFG